MISSKTVSTSIIICTKDRPGPLKRLLNSLSVQTRTPDEIVVVDASVSPRAWRLVDAWKCSGQIPLRYVHTSPGLTRQRNQGVALASGELIFFFDDDVVLEPDYIEVICSTYRDYDGEIDLGGISGRIVNVIQYQKAIDRIFKRFFFLGDIGSGLIKLSGLPTHRVDEQMAFVEILPGASMAYSEKVFYDHAFDGNLQGYAYLEDVDFSYRVSQKYRLLYQPKAKLEHFHTTQKNADTRALRKMMIQHHVYLFKKNMPKDMLHVFGFLMSIIGVFAYNLIMAKDFRACIGIFEGLICPLYPKLEILSGQK